MSMKKKHKKVRKSLKRRILNIIFYFVILVVVLIGTFVLITDTSAGFQYAVKFAKPILKSYGIDITGQLTGDLYDFQISEMKFTTGDKRIELKDLTLTWNPKELIHSHLEVKNVHAIMIWPFETLAHNQNVASNNSKRKTPLTAIQAPNFTYEVDHFDFHLHDKNGKKLMEVTGQTSLKNNKLTVTHVIANGSGFKSQVNGFIDFVTKPQIMLSGPWEINRGKHLFRGSLNINGNFNDYQARLQGQSGNSVEPLAFDIDLQGNLNHLRSNKIIFKRMDGEASGDLKLQFIPLKWTLALTANDLDIHQQVHLNDPLLNFKLKATGTDQGQKLSGTAIMGENNLELSASREQNGSIHVHSFKLHSSTGNWVLTPSTLTETPTGLSLPKTCLKQGKSYVCGQFDINSGEVKGQLHVNLLDLSDFNSFFPQINNLSGQVVGHMNFFGDTKRPYFKGEVKLQNAGLGVPSLGIQLDKTNITIASQQRNKMTLNGMAHSAGGNLSFKGGMYWEKTYPVIAIGISGKQFTVTNLPEAHIVISPDLSYIQNDKVQELIGMVVIDSADINADRFESTAGLDKKDIVFINANNQEIDEQQHSLPFSTTIQVFSKNTVNFTGFGMKANIGGHLFINGIANQGLKGNGKLTVNQGYYAAYGKRFNVTKGELNFTNSPLDDPALDVYAQYQMTAVTAGANNQLNSIKVGVHVSGTVQKIHLSLYSDPPMTQENILSYIITGQPLNEVGPGGQAALSQAAIAFAAGGGDESVLNQIKDKLNLSELSVGSLNTMPTNNLQSSRGDVDQNDTAVFVGKAISDRFYVSYGIGLFNQQQIFRTHFKLTKNWAIQTDNSTLDSGADLIYTFER